MTDEAEVKHELIPPVLFVLDDDWVAADLLRQNVEGHGAACELLLRTDVHTERRFQFSSFQKYFYRKSVNFTLPRF